MKKIYIAAIGATMALSLLFAACGAKDNVPNTTTSTTTNKLQEGITSVSSKLSEAGSDIKSELSKMP